MPLKPSGTAVGRGPDRTEPDSLSLCNGGVQWAVENSSGGRASFSWGAVECLNVDANELSITLEQGSLGGAPFLCLCLLFPGGCELGLYGFERRAARNLSDANEIVWVERAHPHFARLAEFSPQHFGCETLHCCHQPFGRVLAANSADSSAYQVVGCEEADAFFTNESVRQLRDAEKTAASPKAHPLAIHFDMADNAGEEAERAHGIGAHGKRQWLQVILTVYDVREGSIVRASEHGLGLAECLTRQDAHVLQCDRISFLRHDAADLDVSVAQAQKTKLFRAPQQQVLHEFSQIECQHGDSRGRFRQIIDGRDCAVGIYLQPLKAQ